MSDLSLEIIGDFAIVWLLSPKKSFSAAPSGGLSQFVSRLPGHSLQVTTSAQFLLPLSATAYWYWPGMLQQTIHLSP